MANTRKLVMNVVVDGETVIEEEKTTGDGSEKYVIFLKPRLEKHGDEIICGSWVTVSETGSKERKLVMII